MIPTGTYILPPLSEYTVTETIYPDPDARPKMRLTDWVLDNSVPHTHSSNSREIRIHAPFPTDVELDFENDIGGWRYVFDDDYVVST